MKERRIVGSTVYLRPIGREDTDRIVAWRNSEHVRPYFIYQELFTPEGHEQWLRDMIDSGRGWQFIICLIENDMPLGSTYLRDYSPLHRKAEYGVFIGEADWKGRGIGTEALALTLRFAFGEAGLHKVFARAFSDNPASVKSFLKGGFVQEACLKDDVFAGGRFRDIVLLGKINPEEEYFDAREEVTKE